jgi:hypothetical protein
MPPPVIPPPSGTTFDFAKPFTFTFEDPNWLPKILVGGLFYLAGFLIVGWFFIFGYLARFARNVIAGERYPLPEWEDLGDYFAEGLRLFGVGLVWVLPVMLLALILGIPGAILTAMDNQGVQILGGGMMGCLYCLIVPVSLALVFFMPASFLLAVVDQRFSSAFDRHRIWAFIRPNLGNYLLALVVYLIARFIGGFGIILLCIGVIFTGFWSFLITTYAFADVYRLAQKPKP